MLEVSVVVFLSQGYVVSGSDALMRTLIFSGLIATADTFVKVMRISGICFFVFASTSGYAVSKFYVFT